MTDDRRLRLSYPVLRLAVEAGFRGEDAIAKGEQILNVLCSDARKGDEPLSGTEELRGFPLFPPANAANVAEGTTWTSKRDGKTWTVVDGKWQSVPEARVISRDGEIYQDGDIKVEPSGRRYVARDGKWYPIPEAKVIGRDGDKGLQERLNIKGRPPFPDYVLYEP